MQSLAFVIISVLCWLLVPTEESLNLRLRFWNQQGKLEVIPRDLSIKAQSEKDGSGGSSSQWKMYFWL